MDTRKLGSAAHNHNPGSAGPLFLHHHPRRIEEGGRGSNFFLNYNDDAQWPGCLAAATSTTLTGQARASPATPHDNCPAAPRTTASGTSNAVPAPPAAGL
jgi:hypothetical protein